MLPGLRTSFYYSVNSAELTVQTQASLESAFPSPRDAWPPVIRAYDAALEGLKGKHAKGLFEKMRHVVTAISMIRELPASDPYDLEIRFLRFSLFSQLPVFFGVRSSVAPDLAKLIDSLEAARYEQVPRDVQGAMVTYLLGSGIPDQPQIRRLEALRARLTQTP